jgi:hypothetical protein
MMRYNGEDGAMRKSYYVTAENELADVLHMISGLVDYAQQIESDLRERLGDFAQRRSENAVPIDGQKKSPRATADELFKEYLSKTDDELRQLTF